LLWLVKEFFTPCFFLYGCDPEKLGKIYALIKETVE
jgi:hypothetical protein